jgi:ferredoxin--NADP+ reductase
VSAVGSPERPLRVAIIGSGPAGFYSAQELLRSDVAVDVCLFDRLFAPFGLVRYGVAPDHPHMKKVIRQYERIAEDPCFSFRGNVRIGEDVSIDEIEQFYDAIVWTNGAEADRRLDIPGESEPNFFSAMQVVGWYNGHPDYADLPIDLSVEEAAIIGNGNVALDVARMLVKPVEELAKTDIAAHALAALSESRIRRVHLIGRRGPVQSSFRLPEIREMGQLEGCSAHLHWSGEVSAADAEECAAERARNSIFEQLKGFEGPEADRSVHFHFLRQPEAYEAGSLRLATNALQGPAGSQKAVPTGESEVLPVGLSIVSIGQVGRPLEGLPFEASRGILSHEAGRVSKAGHYTAGWIKRGAEGLIGNNKRDAAETIATLLADLPTILPCAQPSDQALDELLVEKSLHPISWADWQLLDAEEIARGETRFCPRLKLGSNAEALVVLEGFLGGKDTLVL